MRAVLPADTPEPRVRLVALVVLVFLWIGARMLLGTLGGVNVG